MLRRAAAWFWKRWAWAIVLAVLWALLGWDRALGLFGALVVLLFALDLYERFRELERQVAELRRLKDGEEFRATHIARITE